jgi:uncharacterized protein (UPF0264 family)
MPLLVSVRSADEVPAALAGGADIIDAKEPARGPLGAVEQEVLSAIGARTPGSVPLSVALGDCTNEAEVRAAVEAARLPERSAPVYLKLGFSGVNSVPRIAELLEAAVDTAAIGLSAPGIVAVAYADHQAAGTVPPRDVLRAAMATGAGGLLVDTWLKDGRGLLDHISLERLAALAASARAARLVIAMAGSLDSDTISRVAEVADVVGVRGAACRDGRLGRVDANRVAELRRLAGTRPALSSVG